MILVIKIIYWIGRKMRNERVQTNSRSLIPYYFYGLFSTLIFLTQRLGVTAKNGLQIRNQQRKIH